jgi:hypothetical protein
MEQYSFEGTWEDILRHAPELTGRRVKLTVLTNDPPESRAEVTLDQVLKGRVGRVAFQPTDLSTRTTEAFGDLLDEKYNSWELGQ